MFCGSDDNSLYIFFLLVNINYELSLHIWAVVLIIKDVGHLQFTSTHFHFSERFCGGYCPNTPASGYNLTTSMHNAINWGDYICLIYDKPVESDRCSCKNCILAKFRTFATSHMDILKLYINNLWFIMFNISSKCVVFLSVFKNTWRILIRTYVGKLTII